MTSPPDVIVQMAVAASVQSPCRSKRGVVVFRGQSALSLGYNFKPGQFACDGSAECKSTCAKGAIHAEQAALLATAPHDRNAAEMLHVKTVSGVLVPSGNPSCLECSKLILHSGLAGMWLYHDSGWRRYEAEEFHQLTLEHHRRTTA